MCFAPVHEGAISPLSHRVLWARGRRSVSCLIRESGESTCLHRTGKASCIQGCSCIAECCPQAPGLARSVTNDNVDSLVCTSRHTEGNIFGIALLGSELRKVDEGKTVNGTRSLVHGDRGSNRVGCIGAHTTIATLSSELSS